MIGRWNELDVTRAVLRRRVATGDATRLGRGVYVDGPNQHAAAGWLQGLAALSAANPDGRHGGEAAAALYELDGFDPGAPPVVHRSAGRSGRGALVRRVTELQPPITIAGMAVCGIDELLLGLGAEVAPRPGCAAARTRLDAVELVELAVEAALRKELTDVESLWAAVASSRPNRPGRAVLRQVLAMRPPDAKPTGSYLETRCVQVLRNASVPAFDRQVELHDGDGFIGIVDFHLDGAVIEIVGRIWHDPKVDPDHVRHARLGAAGYRFVPFTFADVEFRPGHVVSSTVAALRHARAS